MKSMKMIRLTETENYRVQGRTVASRDPLILLWTGASLDLCVQGSELWVELEGPYEQYENWVLFEINGEVLSRQMVDRQRRFVCVFRGREPERITQVRIIKEVQAMSADPKHCLKIYGLRLDGQLLPVPEKKCRLEFVGDSITSGEGAIGAVAEEEWISSFFGHERSYPYLVSKALDAEYRVISQSGWGVFASWDNRRECVLPKHYEQICSLVPGEEFRNCGFYEKNDFAAWQPDVVCVNLGTNDDGAFGHPGSFDPLTGTLWKLRMVGEAYLEEDRLLVQHAVKDFLGMLRRNDPKALILWCFGLAGDRLAPTIQAAIAEYCRDTEDSRVAYVPLPETTQETMGARVHPGYAAHQAAAQIIAEIIKREIF
ncbi:MAG: GDSL family lipase [Lachnospiraceae bacterium]|nr:GDSL family lipase [Lachnospiraceae bacterium]